MGHKPGEPIHGILSNSDVSTATAVPIYNNGSNTARTLADDEYLTIDSIEIVHAAGGDLHLFVGADGTPGTGETIARGTVAANGGIVDEGICHSGLPGHTLWIASDAAGQVDVKVHGTIRRVMDGKRRSWQADNSGT